MKQLSLYFRNGRWHIVDPPWVDPIFDAYRDRANNFYLDACLKGYSEADALLYAEKKIYAEILGVGWA